MHLVRAVPFLVLAVAGCATVHVEVTQRANDPSPIEPVAVILFQSSTPPSHSQILERALSAEMRQRGIAASFTIVPGSEKAKGGVVATALADVAGAIIIAPSDGTPSVNGVTVPVYYDVRALRILKHPGPAVEGSGPNGTTPINDGLGRSTYVWRGRAYAGRLTDENLREVASQIVVRLVADHVLRATP